MLTRFIMTLPLTLTMAAAAHAAPLQARVDMHLPLTLAAQDSAVHGKGTVNAIDAGNRKINMSHGPIPALGWPAMRMDFQVGDTVDLKDINVGTEVDFELVKKGDAFEIKSIKPAKE